MARLLIVDDDKDLLSVLKSLLVKKGFDVSTFSEWEDANEAIMHSLPQLILLDIFLPGIDGLAICKKLKSDAHTRNVPILIFSGYPAFAERAMSEFGAADFISKPFEINDFIEKIHLILSKREQSS
jgi:DNA-binding response OmpR family regulator